MPVFVDTIMPPLEPSVEKTGLPGRQASRFSAILKEKRRGESQNTAASGRGYLPKPLACERKEGRRAKASAARMKKESATGIRGAKKCITPYCYLVYSI